MLRLPEFQVHQPTTAADALRLRSELPDAMYIAGGTDLLPNLKHHLHAPRHLVSLDRVQELRGIRSDGQGGVVIGAGTSLQQVADSEQVRTLSPAVAIAAGLVAGPQHRRMGTLGGNIMLDTRCLYYNQSRGWRQSLGYCLKKEGDWCHVIDSPRRCVAAQSADTVPPLIAIGATLDVLEPEGARRVPLVELYRQDGRYEQRLRLGATALLRAVHLPAQPAGHRSIYRKVRARQAVDFPQLGLALAGRFEGEQLRELCAVVGAILPRPKRIDLTKSVGGRLSDQLIDQLSETIRRRSAPQRSIHGDPDWRRHLAGVEARRGLRQLRDDALARP